MKKRRAMIGMVVMSLLLVVSLVACESPVDYKPYKSDYYSKEDNSLFKTYAKAEANYLRSSFSMIGDRVDLWFPEDISTLDFSDFKLAYQNQVIEGEYKIDKIDKNTIDLVLNEYIPEFDSIVIDYKGKSLWLYTGYYTFEQQEQVPFEEREEALNKDYLMVPHRSEADKSSYVLDYVLYQPAKGSLKASFPQAMPKNLLHSEFKQKGSKGKASFYQHSLKPNQDVFAQEGLQRVSVDVCYQLDNEGQPNLATEVYQARVPFQMIE